MQTVHVYISTTRRLVLYPEGGMMQQEHVKGQGWTVADDDNWGHAVADALLAAAEAVRRQAHLAIMALAEGQ